jgi:hypothetical protein
MFRALPAIICYREASLHAPLLDLLGREPMVARWAA